MADVLVNIEEASKQLQLSKDQITEMVKKGLLRGFLDQKTYKFRPADIDAFKKKLASGATTLSDGSSKTDAVPGGGHATSKIDLTEIEADTGVEDTDQTSVLAPVKTSDPKDKAPEKPVFKFGQKDFDLHDDEPAVEEGDQTSLLMPGPGKGEKGKPGAKPEFGFAEKDLKLPADGDTGDSVLVADESESSMDILEVAEESSSESGSSASRLAFSDEVTSGDEIEAAPESSAKAGQKPAPKSGPRANEPSTDKVVADILGPAPEDSDEALETLDVEEGVEAKETAGAATDANPEAAALAPFPDEHETVGIPAADETKATAGVEDTKAAMGAEGEAGETGGMDGAVAAALQEQAGEEEPAEAEAEEAAQTIVPAGWETAQSWPIGNGLLIAATVVLVIAGVLIVCQAFNIQDSFTNSIANMLQGHAH
jgi:hypothetical protein